LILLSGIMKYEAYLNYVGGETQSQKLLLAFIEIKDAIGSYMKVKFIISLLYGAGITLICFLFGLQYAFFWGFIGFFLNFLPVFGAIIGLIPVFILGLIQFESPYTAVLLNLIIYAFHFVLSNVLEPVMLGAKTSLNVIAVILGLLFWGFLWGIYGMFLSVPLMVLTKVVLSQIQGTELIVRLLGVQENQK
jgi:AI-2 transport protein TqsA